MVPKCLTVPAALPGAGCRRKVNFLEDSGLRFIKIKGAPVKGSEEQKGTDTNMHFHTCSPNLGSRTKYGKSHIRGNKGLSAGRSAVIKMLGVWLVQRQG